MITNGKKVVSLTGQNGPNLPENTRFTANYATNLNKNDNYHDESTQNDIFKARKGVVQMLRNVIFNWSKWTHITWKHSVFSYLCNEFV